MQLTSLLTVILGASSALAAALPTADTSADIDAVSNGTDTDNVLEARTTGTCRYKANHKKYFVQSTTYTFEVDDVDGWGDITKQDLSDKSNLYSNLHGCSDKLQGWQNPSDTSVKFNIYGFKGGCIERAIKSAGGPSLSCAETLK